jgi:hypothetical protein
MGCEGKAREREEKEGRERESEGGTEKKERRKERGKYGLWIAFEYFLSVRSYSFFFFFPSSFLSNRK